jgi:hypothetical protein
MKLSKLTERMITIALVAILVGLCFYQVAYGHTPAYWYGYKNGKGLGGIFDIGDSCDGIVSDNGRTINLTADHTSFRSRCSHFPFVY